MTARNPGAILPRTVGPVEGAPPVARVLASTPERSVSRPARRGGRRRNRGGNRQSQDIAARDDAHLRSLGHQARAERTLGFLSNFAIAFSFISVSTGSFGNFGVGIGLGRTGVLLVVAHRHHRSVHRRLVFAELASHFPVAGSIYQWSKRLSNRTLGWFTGWFYFWAQVVTVTAVAVIVGLRHRWDHRPGGEGFLDSPVPLGLTTMFTFIALTTLVLTTLINAFGVRLLSTLNNIGVATEILGMVVFALILLFFANNQSPTVLIDTAGTEAATNGNYLPAFALGMFMAIFILYGFDTAGTFGEETIDASRQAPRGVISSVMISGRRDDLPARRHPGDPETSRTPIGRGPGGGFPIATTITADPDRRALRRASRSARSTCSSSSRRCSSARSRSRAPRPG